jgi:hypothetical protein
MEQGNNRGGVVAFSRRYKRHARKANNLNRFWASDEQIEIGTHGPEIELTQTEGGTNPLRESLQLRSSAVLLSDKGATRRPNVSRAGLA